MYQPEQLICLKREKFRVNIRKQRLTEHFAKNRKILPLNSENKESNREIEFMGQLISELETIDLGNIEGINNLLSVTIKAFEESRGSSHIFSEMWSQKLDLLIHISAIDSEIRCFSQLIVYFILFNLQEDQMYILDKFETQTIIEYINMNCRSHDLRLLEYSLQTLVNLAEQKNIYKNIIQENDMNLIKQVIEIDKHHQLTEIILGLMLYAFDSEQQIPYLNVVTVFQEYIMQNYFMEELSIRQLVLRLIQIIIEKVEEDFQLSYVKTILSSTQFKSILQNAKSDYIYNTLPIKICVYCYGIDDTFTDDRLIFFHNLILKYCNTQSELRMQIYWALSNKATTHNDICLLIHHELFKDIIEFSRNETLNCQLELSYLFMNISYAGQAQHCSYAIKQGLLDALKIFLNSTNKDLCDNVTKTLIHLMKTIKENPDKNNDILISFEELREQIEKKQIVNMVQQSNVIKNDLINQFDVFF